MNALKGDKFYFEKFDGCKFTKDLEFLLNRTDVPFEVIDGIVCIKSKPVYHAIAKNIVSNQLNQWLISNGSRCESMIEVRMIRGLNFGNDFLIPDIVVLNLQECSYGVNGMLLGTPKLVIEIMSSNRNDDISRKRLIYEKMMIPEYWIVDIDGECITQHVLKGDKFENPSLLFSSGVVAHKGCGLEIEVVEIFNEIKKRITYLGGSKPTSFF